MRNFFTIVLLFLLTGLAVAEADKGTPIFPPPFEGLAVTEDAVIVTKAKDDWVIVSLRVVVPEGAKPMNAFREDMWQRGQLRKEIAYVEGNRLTAEQTYRILFCVLNREFQGFSCKNTSEIDTARTDVPWVIPVATMPSEFVPAFTSSLVKAGPIPASLTRVSEAPRRQQMPAQEAYNRQILWSSGSMNMPVGPPEMEWYSGTVPEHLRVDKPPSKTTTKSSGPTWSKKAGAGGPPSKDRTP